MLLVVPDDVAIVGKNARGPSTRTSLSVTTVRLPFEHLNQAIQDINDEATLNYLLNCIVNLFTSSHMITNTSNWNWEITHSTDFTIAHTLPWAKEKDLGLRSWYHAGARYMFATRGRPINGGVGKAAVSFLLSLLSLKLNEEIGPLWNHTFARSREEKQMPVIAKLVFTAQD